MIKTICPTCQTEIDARIALVRIVGARVLSFCSADCSANFGTDQKAAPAPKLSAKPKAAKPSVLSASLPAISKLLPRSTTASSSPVRTAVGPAPEDDFTDELSDVVGGHEVTEGRRAVDSVDDGWDMPKPPAATPPPRRRNRRVIAGASAVFLAGMIVVAVEAWPTSSADGGQDATKGIAAALVTPSDIGPDDADDESADEAEFLDPAQLFEQASAELRALLSSDSSRVRRIAAMALSRTGDAEAIAELKMLLPNEQSALARVEIGYALARANDPAGTKELARALQSRTRDVKLDAARSFVRLGSDRGAGPLRGLFSYRHYRIAAAGWLARLGDPKGVALLKNELRTSRSNEHKMRAAVALGLARDESVRERLVEIMKNRRYQVGAAQALAALGDATAVPTLTKQLQIDAIRVQAALALRRLGADVDLGSLAAFVNSGNEVVRVTAAEAIMILTGPAELAKVD